MIFIKRYANIKLFEEDRVDQFWCNLCFLQMRRQGWQDIK